MLSRGQQFSRDLGSDDKVFERDGINLTFVMFICRVFVIFLIILNTVKQ